MENNVNKDNSWGGWKSMSISHNQVMTMMKTLIKHTDDFRSGLVAAKEKRDEEKSESKNIYDTANTNAAEKHKSNEDSYISERDKKISGERKRISQLDKVFSACKSYNEVVNNKEPMVSAASNAGINLVSQKREKVLNAINAKIEAYNTLCNCQIAESQRVKNDSISKARDEQIVRDENAEKKYTSNYNDQVEKCKEDIERGFNKQILKLYKQEIKASRFNANNFESPTDVPDYIMLGNIGAIFPNDSKEDKEIVDAIQLQASDISKNTNSGYSLQIPYSQRLIDGISLLMRYLPKDRKRVQSYMQPLLMKLFMSFPAGKLEATMIDPLELGNSFPDIPKLAGGLNSARVIDTKIWSQEKDIEKAIRTLRQRLENMTQAYGEDKKSRLKKEVIRALAITDFPVNFTEAALKDLHAIVRNSSELGVCVLICANNDELQKLKEKNESLVREIEESLVRTKASGNVLIFDEIANSRLFLELDSMQDVNENKEEIISVLKRNIEHCVLKVEKFEDMYDFDIFNSNNWFTGEQNEISIPIGIKGADTVIPMVMGRGSGSTEHHALITGITGSGKSTLLHTLILSTLINYSPKQVQMYLLDFKEGIEFTEYARNRLPSLRVIAINSEREFGLIVLKELCTEFQNRSNIFRENGVSDIEEYLKQDGAVMPRLLLIFDEVQELFRSVGESDSIKNESLSCIKQLVRQGRAAGIHIILASQDFHNCPGIEECFSQMSIRIAEKGDITGAASILESDNKGIEALQNMPAGSAIYNNRGGVESANDFFQVAYMDKEKREKLLNCLDKYYTNPVVANEYKDMQMRILLTNAEDNVYNPFNRMILNGKTGVEPLTDSKNGYGLLLGQSFEKKSIFIPEIRTEESDNLLIVSPDEKMAISLFILTAVSVLYEELHTDSDKSNALVYIIDFSENDDLTELECDLSYLENCFPKQVKLAIPQEMDSMITSLYETLLNRLSGDGPSSERLFFMFFGLDGARRLTEDMYDQEEGDELSTLAKLKAIIKKGSKVGINSVVWGQSFQGLNRITGDSFASMFRKRIAHNLDEGTMDNLVWELDSTEIKDSKIAVYLDCISDTRNTHFRPYDIPSKSWISLFADKYDEIIK